MRRSLLKQFLLDAEELAAKQYAKDVRIAEFRRACERHVAKLEAEKAELASQLEQVHGKQEIWTQPTVPALKTARFKRQG
jgi:hypothetical protein